MNGWIKLYRQLLDSAMWNKLNSDQKNVMITCLLLANHEPNQWEWMGKIFTVNKGQFITSLQNLSLKCKLSLQTIRTALNKLKIWNFLTDESTKTGRLITIINWDKFQGNNVLLTDKLTDKLTVNQQSSNSHLTTNKKDKNEKNEKKEDLKEYILPTKKKSAVVKKTQKSQDTNPDIKTFISKFYDLFKEKFEYPYQVQRGKDGMIVKQMLQTYKLNELLSFLDDFFDLSSDDFLLKKMGYTIGAFKIKLPMIIMRRQEDD